MESPGYELSRTARRPLRRRDDGQVLVEAAIVLPAMTFLILCTLQITMIQHARIMTEYAAFSAARAGAVFNADPVAMRKAAEIALVPTMERSDDLTTFLVAHVKQQLMHTVKRALTGVRPVSVRILNPRIGDFNAANAGHLNNREIDFDDVRTATSRATLLSIEVRYLYEMRIPFANRMILAIFLASAGRGYNGTSTSSSLDRWTGPDMLAPKLITNNGPDAVAVSSFLSPAEQKLAGNALVRGGLTRIYQFPLFATYSIRMQSNPYLDKVQAAQNFQ